MIRHEYSGHGGPPLPPQISADAFRRWEPSASPSAPSCKQGPGAALPLVPASRPCSDHSAAATPAKYTQYPYVTGSSVVAFKYKDGVLLASDMQGAYGRTRRYKSVERIFQVAPNTVLGGSGEISDLHYIRTLLDELLTEDFTEDDGHVLGPREIHSYLTRVLYNRRNKFDPLWNTLLVAGVEPRDGTPFLGSVSMIGVQVEDDNLATGYGSYLARPLLREAEHLTMGDVEALHLMEKCLEVLVSRDSSCSNKIQVAKITADGVSISQPYAISANWEWKFFEDPMKDPYSGSW